MAPRGTKRAASTAGKGNAAKVPKESPEVKRVNDFMKSQGVSKSTFNAVVEIVEHPDAELPEDCVKLLRAALPYSLCVSKDQRHESQDAVVNMVSEISEDVAKKLEAKVVEATQAVTKAEEGESAAQEQLKEAEGQAAEAETSAKERTKELADNTGKMSALRRAVKEAKSEQGRQEKRLAGVEKEKNNYELILNESFRKIKELTWEEAEGAGLLKSMTAAAGKLGLEDSLTNALPTTLLKRERGPFDTMVIESLEDGLTKKIQALTEDTNTIQAEVQEHMKSVEATEKDLEQATEAQQASAEELSHAQEQENKSKEKLGEAKHEASNMTERLTVAKETARLVEEAKQTFKDFNVEMFTHLRERTTPVPEEKAPADADMVTETTA